MSDTNAYASPPCMATEIDPAYVDPFGVSTAPAHETASPHPMHPKPDEMPKDRAVTETGRPQKGRAET